MEFFTFSCNESQFLNFTLGAPLFVFGTPNLWKMVPSDDWELKCLGEGKYELKKPLSEVSLVGNTGFPEFRYFQAVENAALERNLVTLEERPGAFCDILAGNHVVFDKKNKADLAAFSKIAQVKVIKTLADFDITKKSEREKLANVRSVPGTKALFRGYHPYKKSRIELDTEALRTKVVNEYLIEKGIKSVISLCGDEEPISALGEEKSGYFLAIERAGGRLSLDIDYNCVYYESSGETFCLAMKEIVQFILAREAPFYVHCRLGSDRTGVVCATLAKICGTPKSKIEADYERTTEAGIGEFRSRKLLNYALGRINIDKIATKKEQEALKKKLCG